MLNRESILSIKDYKVKPLTVPEWNNETIYVRTMTGQDRDRFEYLAMQMADDKEQMIGVRAKLAVMTICDENGELLFTDADLKALGDKSGVALDRVFEAAQEINRITDEEVEQLEKKSESAQS